MGLTKPFRSRSRAWGPSLAVTGIVVLAGCAQRDATMYGIGHAPSLSEIAAWDIDVNARGDGLPPGGGTVAQGAAYYAGLCASCHGARGEGTQLASQLIRPDSGSGTPRRNIATHWPYAPPLFDYIRRAMPPGASAPYGADTIYAIVAHLLEANHVNVPNHRADQSTLPSVAMPARQRFVVDDRRGGHELR